MYKISIEGGYAGRFNTQQECLNWRNLKHPNKSYTIEDISATIIIQKLWESCNDYCLSKIDSNDRARYAVWMVDGNESQKIKIRANVAWVDSIWNEYYLRKATLMQNYDWSSFGDPPHTFYEIATSI
jgi:hypothetical protein